MGYSCNKIYTWDNVTVWDSVTVWCIVLQGAPQCVALIKRNVLR